MNPRDGFGTPKTCRWERTPREHPGEDVWLSGRRPAINMDARGRTNRELQTVMIHQHLKNVVYLFNVEVKCEFVKQS